jgi:CRISPR system Cascade subunit CasB
MTQQALSNGSRDERFIEATIDRCLSDKGLAARLRRAANPATEYQSWEYLASWGVDLEAAHQRRHYARIAAAIAQARPKNNGSLRFGRALARAYDGNTEGPATARLRRLLACHSDEEVVRVIGPMLSLIGSRVNEALDYKKLLGQLRYFHFDPEKIKSQWAADFYSTDTYSQEQSTAVSEQKEGQ